MSTVRVDEKYYHSLKAAAAELDKAKLRAGALHDAVADGHWHTHLGPQHDCTLAAIADLKRERDALRATLDGIANHLRTWATSSAAHAEEFSGSDERQAYTRTDVHRARAAAVDEAAAFVEGRIRVLSETSCPPDSMSRRTCERVASVGGDDAPQCDTCPLRGVPR